MLSLLESGAIGSCEKSGSGITAARTGVGGDGGDDDEDDDENTAGAAAALVNTTRTGTLSHVTGVDGAQSRSASVPATLGVCDSAGALASEVIWTGNETAES